MFGNVEGITGGCKFEKLVKVHKLSIKERLQRKLYLFFKYPGNFSNIIQDIRPCDTLEIPCFSHFRASKLTKMIT